MKENKSLNVPYKAVNNYIVHRLANVCRVLSFHKALYYVGSMREKGARRLSGSKTCVSGAWPIVRCSVCFR